MVETFKTMLIERKMFRQLTLYFDIETFQYNETNGQHRPSEYKNMTFSVALSWISNGQTTEVLFPNFKQVFDCIIEVYGQSKTAPRIILNAHNTNKYDNHFLRYDLLYYYDMELENFHLTTATTDEGNEHALRLKDLTKDQKQGIILEKRVKSSINLELIFFLKGIQFETEDNWVKTNASIKTLGKKLHRLGYVTDEELKTDFDYLKHNKSYDMTDKAARSYAEDVFNDLTDDEITYIRNDVILLAKSVYYYSELFQGFSYDKPTFTSNILETYNDNDLTSFQLLNRVGKGKDRVEIRYTDYQFGNQNFYDYLKPFYRGGLNFYNQFHVGKVIHGAFGMDIHSSYPYAMHNFKIPTFLKSYEEHETPEEIEIIYDEDEYSLYRLSKETFDFYILDRIDSVILKQILVKYYSTNEFINVNSYTFRMLENIAGLRFESIPAFSRVTFETAYFGSREQIEEFYFIKEQSKRPFKLDYQSPYNITETDEVNDTVYTSAEVDITKVNLNGLYGIPALRPYFNLFRLDEQKENYVNIENGHKNAERNIVFSIFVTSVSLWNLLNPFKYLTQQEIDDYFIYCDTDSLYFMKEVQHKLGKELFTDYDLGTWEMEHETISHFYVLNHKKYAFIDPNDFNKDGSPKGIQVRAGGVPKDTFNTDMSFDEFIQTQFSHGVELKNNKSIYNNQGTISIYPSSTKLEVGKGYRIHSNGQVYKHMKEKMIQEIKEQADQLTDDVLYIESILGTFSVSDIYPFEHTVSNKEPLIFLELKQDKIKYIVD